MVHLTPQTRSIVLLAWMCLFLLLGIRGGFENDHFYVEQVEVEKSQSQENQLTSDPRKNVTVALSSSDALSLSLDDPAVIGNCSFNLHGHKPIMDEIVVMPMTKSSPSILCYVMCTSAYHQRVKIIKDTWGGGRCDGFFIASDTNDKALGAVAIPTMNHPHTRGFLWDKQRETIRYLYKHNISQQYDWTFKADTDTYAIIDNLKAHLSTLAVDLSKPQLVGHKLYLPEGGRARHGLLSDFSEYLEKQDKEDQWMFAAGGGYAMNRKFVEAMATSLDTVGCRSKKNVGEDVGTAFCVASKYPLSIGSSRDENGREMFNLHPPRKTYLLSKNWWPLYHPIPYNPAPPIGNESYSRHSVLFHGMKWDDRVLYWMHNQLYSCRE